MRPTQPIAGPSGRRAAYERSYGSFSRSFTLPDGVDSEHIDAGVLRITIPKAAAPKPKKISLKQRVKNALSSS